MNNKKRLWVNTIPGKTAIVIGTIAVAALCIAIPDLWLNDELKAMHERGGEHPDLFWSTASMCVMCICICAPSADHIRKARKAGRLALAGAAAWWLTQIAAMLAVTILSVRVLLSLDTSPSALDVFLTLLLGTIITGAIAAGWWWGRKQNRPSRLKGVTVKLT